jgi:antagonist of KipI
MKVIRPGFLTTVQDLGRAGSRKSGVSAGGAVDTHALRIANQLVANDESAAALEVTFGGLRLRFSDERCIAWCGGTFEAKIGRVKLPPGRAAVISSAEELTFEGAAAGCRAWLAISGGIDVPLVLGSRATDLRAVFGGLEGRALIEGDEVPLGELSSDNRALAAKLEAMRVADWGAAPGWASPLRTNETRLRVIRGADSMRFSPQTFETFLSQAFTVSADSDRMAVRLEGSPLRRCDDGADLVSEAVAPGTIQVPAGGQPILLLADSQTIGGYPKLAHVITVDLPLAAQLCPGNRVRFQEVSIAEAHRLLFQRECDVAKFRIGLSQH